MRTRSCLAFVTVSAALVLTDTAANAQRGFGFGAGRPLTMRPFAGGQVVTGGNRLKASRTFVRPVGTSRNAHPDFAWNPTGRPTASRFDGRYYITGVTHRHTRKGGRSIGGLKAEQDVVEQSGGDADLRIRAGAPPSITRTRGPGFR